jgi:hypothetical protein
MKRNVQSPESYLFYGLLLLHCLPVLLLDYFVTHDGPAHVYNASLLKNILFDRQSTAAVFFSLRSFPEPNWIGHALMLLLSFIVDGNVAERMLLLVFIIFLPLSFRKLLRQINPESVWLSYLIFPFIYSYAFYGGLYNFMLGIPVLLYAVAYFLGRDRPLVVGNYVFLFLTSMVLYFSHLVIFGVFVILISIFQVLQARRKNSLPAGDCRQTITTFLSPLFILLPAIFLSLNFILKKISAPADHLPVSFQHLIHDLFIVIPTIALSEKRESGYAYVLASLLAVLIVSTSVNSRRVRTHSDSEPTPPFRQRLSLFWLSGCLCMLLLYFLIPDEFASGGVVKVRFSYFFFLFLILLLATQNLSQQVLKITAALIIITSVFKLTHFATSSVQLNADAIVFSSASALIEPNSIVLPLNYSANWMHSNLSNYLGTSNHIIILDNYEAGRAHFPLVWKPGKNPVTLMGSFNGDLPLCAATEKFETATGKKVDYIIRWKYDTELTDSCSVQIRHTIQHDYTLVFKTLDKQLYMYKRKNNN